jgi:hypothetical protein
MSVERRIRWRFEGESPSVVLKGFAVLGYRKKATAQAVGIAPCTLRVLAKRLGVEFLPYKELNKSCKAPGRKKAE